MSTSLGERRRHRGFPWLLMLSLLLLVAAVALLINELVGFSRREQQLPAGISVAGINISRLNERDAVARWERAYAEPVELLYPSEAGAQLILLYPDQVGWRISSESMLADALELGEQGGGFWRRFIDYLLGIEQIVSRDIPLNADYQENTLRAYLEDIAARYDKPPGSASYDLQALVVYPGNSGNTLDVASAINRVDAALRSAVARAVDLPTLAVNTQALRLDALRELIIALLDDKGFIYDGVNTVASVYILDLRGGEEISILGDVAFSAASTIKVPIMVEYFRSLSTPPTNDEAWLLANSLLCSNNSSSNLIMEIIGGGDIFRGLRRVSDTAQALSISNTYITAPFYLGVAGQQLGSIQAPATAPNPNFDTEADPFNQTTAEDMGALFNLIYDCAHYNSGLALALPGAVTQRECRQMLELGSANDLLRLLQGGIPSGVRISHKNGWIADSVGDAGVVYSPNGNHYVISVFLWERSEFQDYQKLWSLVEEISRAAWNYFNPQAPLLQPRADTPLTAQECEGNYLPPAPDYVNLDDINGWRRN
ncbi:MAG: serine hydrolase [Chloroflexi bacterium]|nr:serine hydrolase [Chloroflexota bacterium]MCY3717257.1 serine hydrolase [Chloroflexota bacterium]MDE2651451.1 serine hydrolase [Chloroflexota bacterium]MYA94316.1 class A beta-lactamase-related serine hydrolase [Chloroflexota bacterium]MYC54307.1 class A beta-lactamase-related serine hydrolase [Chloroflexota bacterium]